MSERKTIQINPDLFKISNKNTSRKKTQGSQKIELKSELKMQKQKTLRKNVLKMIREKQQDAYREIFDSKKSVKSSPVAPEFNKEFDESLKFFSSLANKVENETSFNSTIKNREPLSPPIIASTLPSISPLPFSQLPAITPSAPPFQIVPPPQYGCLKNGTLPTYRMYTQKNYGSQGLHGGTPDNQANKPFMTTSQSSMDKLLQDTPLLSRPFPEAESSQKEISQNSIFTPKFIEQSQKFDKIHKGKIQPSKAERKIRYKKRKKIFKRTYRIGRSKTEPKVGVLVSNKTIRNRISTEAQLLKQTPIQDVRRFLIKKGFIKVGTNAPNDVLRKMYETVSLVCGEIQNHNPDTLLYNFVNDKE